MQVTGAQQNFLVYTPRLASQDEEARPLTPGLWQAQMRKLDGLMNQAPVEPPARVKEAPPTVEPVPGRNGKLLGPKNFMKADEYPGLHDPRLQGGKHPQPRIEGAANYRELGENIHGTAMPTIDGARGVLKQAGRGPGSTGKPAIWTNLREEPIVYVNGKPYNLRHIKAPFYNQASPGRTAGEVEKMERDLKTELIAEAQRNGGKITLHEEEAGPPARVVERQVDIKEVQTPREVFDQLKSEGYNVEYQRIPVTDMKKPEDGDLDELVNALKDADPDSPLIFNCHAGQGRTTTAMVIASILRRAKNGEQGDLLKEEALREDIKEQGDHAPKNYRGLLRAVKDSQRMMESQEEADRVIEKYSGVVDLKGSAKEAREAAETKGTDSSRERAADYLERYHTIVSFESYAKDQAPDFKVSYSEWKRQHPEVQENLERLQVAMVHGTAGPAVA